jgi:hypothetical protein
MSTYIDKDPCRCCTELYHEPPTPIPVPHTCPKCDKPLAPNEWFAYRRCEDCWVGDTPGSTYAGPKVLRDFYGKDPAGSDFGYNTGGGDRVERQRVGMAKTG